MLVSYALHLDQYAQTAVKAQSFVDWMEETEATATMPSAVTTPWLNPRAAEDRICEGKSGMNKLRSAIHYPHSTISNVDTMKHALLLWDKIHVIGPWKGFDPGHKGEIGEAWAMVGRVTVPDPAEQRRAHKDIVTFLEARDRLGPKFFLNADKAASEIYEVYPQKLLGETWDKLVQAGLAGDLLPNADRPLTTWGGLVIMAKLADACAGQVFARVTDRTAAYRAIADELERPEEFSRDAAAAVPVLLSLIDASSLPLENLMRFRDDERDPTLRHRLLDAVNDHVDALRKVESLNQITALQEQFEGEMRRNLKDLRDALRWNKIRFTVSASILTVVTGAFAAGTALLSGPMQVGAALGALSTAGIGVKQVSDFFGAGLDLSERQRTTLAKHPMAYMHLLSRHRIRTARRGARDRRP
jgi:hypothetical protein